MELTEADMPTLEDLRESDQPAWLWDAVRGRAVWANAAGLVFFSCETLFDLVDQPFDLKEPGIQRIAALAHQLQRGKPSQALLAFPSAGMSDPISCLCYVHALPDGRAGVLAVKRADVLSNEPPAADDLASAFDAMPLPALLASLDGDIRHSNEAARILLPSFRLTSLGGLIGDEQRAADLMLRLESAGTVSFIERLATRNGQRDIRITLKRSGPSRDADTSRALILLNDVTERRALERQLQSAEPPTADRQKRMSVEDEATFVALGKRLNGDTVTAAKPQPVKPVAESPAIPVVATVVADPVPPAPIVAAAPVMPAPAAAAPPASPPVIERHVSDIPTFLSAAIESRPGGHVVVKNGTVVYANAEALRVLGFADLPSMTVAPELVQALADASGSADAPSAIAREATVMRSQIPWQNGPAECFTLTPRHTPPPTHQPTPPRMDEDAPRPLAQATFPSFDLTPSAATAKAEPAAEPAKDAVPVRHSIEAADEELRAILDTASDGIITLDSNGRIRSFSAGAEAIFGYRTAEVADKPFADLLASESRKVLRDYLAALQGPGLAAVFNDGREISAVVKQGGEVPLFMTIGRLQKSGISGASFCAVVRDITQWKRTEKDLREAKDSAELASRQKSEFLAQISHELRTPLNAILGFSEVMRLERFGEIRNEKYRGYVNDIHTSGAHLLSLINDLLDLSKVEAGKLELNFTAVNLADAADHAIRLTQDLATSGRVIVRKSFPPGLPNVVADQRSIRQILLNLLSNAIKFTDPGGQVIVSAQTSQAGELKLRVKDTGIGMTAPELKEAMEPFRRVVTEGRDRQGTGLGLPLTKALAEANRTTFAISSEPRKGTLVEITFPVTRVLAE